jgi:Lecithin retinol acyltransferase
LDVMIVSQIDPLTCLTSEWFDYDRRQLLKDVLRNGDLVQIKSEATSGEEDQWWEHWGVVIEYNMHNDDLITTIEKDIKGQPDDILIVHLNNPTSKLFRSSSSSRPCRRSDSKQWIYIDKIDKVWKNHAIRRHNFRNLYWSPYTWSEMKKRIKEEVRKNKCYCLISNNCEMFSHRVRYGHSYSGQVEMLWKDVHCYSFIFISFFFFVYFIVSYILYLIHFHASLCYFVDFRYYLFSRCFWFIFSTYVSGIRYG